MSRIIFFGDLGPTGFGTVTRDLGAELLKLGHDVRFVSQNEVEDVLPEPFDSRTWRVAAEDPFEASLQEGVNGGRGLGRGSLALQSIGYMGFFDGRLWKDDWKPEVGIVLGDPGNIRLMVMRDEHTVAAFSSVPMLHYVPIEGVDLPPTWREMWSFLKPVAMTNFGADQIEKVMGKRPPMVYHGVDTDVFRPVSPSNMLVITTTENGVPIIHKLRSREDCKKLIGKTTQGRWLLRTDSNWPRKRYPELFRSMAPVLHERPDVTLVVHCQRRGVGGDLDDWRQKYPAHIRDRIIITNAGGQVSREWLVALYNAADLYVTNSAEGFGLTPAESLACGTPAVGIDYSSLPEVIGPGGVVTPIAGLVDNEYGYFWAAADQRLFGKAVADLLDDPQARKTMGRAGREHVKSMFQWGKAALQFSALVHEAVESEAAA